MGEWFRSAAEQPWLLWIAAALVLGIIELTSLDLIFLMLAGGALAGAAAAGLGAGAAGQVVVALAAALLLAATVRPVLLRRLHVPPASSTGTAALVGRAAVALSEVTDRGGLVKLAGETWSARTAPGAVLGPGDDAVVTAIEGATAVVAPARGRTPGTPPLPDVRPGHPHREEES